VLQAGCDRDRTQQRDIAARLGAGAADDFPTGLGDDEGGDVFPRAFEWQPVGAEPRTSPCCG
jgi:hypothetical protein